MRGLQCNIKCAIVSAERQHPPCTRALDARAQYLQELRLEVALESAALPLTVLTGLDGGVKMREARLVPLEEVFRMIEAISAHAPLGAAAHALTDKCRRRAEPRRLPLAAR